MPHRLRKKRTGVIVHIAPSATADFNTRDGVPITSVVRTIRDIAANTTVDDVTSIVREAEQHGLLRQREAQQLAHELVGST